MIRVRKSHFKANQLSEVAQIGVGEQWKRHAAFLTVRTESAAAATSRRTTWEKKKKKSSFETPSTPLMFKPDINLFPRSNSRDELVFHRTSSRAS